VTELYLFGPQFYRAVLLLDLLRARSLAIETAEAIHSMTEVLRRASPKAFISGITGQDGSYLAEFLLAKGYKVHGNIRRTSTFNTDRLDHIYPDPHEAATGLHLRYGDLAGGSRLSLLINEIQPDEVYNLRAQVSCAGEFQSSRVHGRYRGRRDVTLVGSVSRLCG